MIKAVFFDLGNVLVSFDWKISARKIADHCDRSFDEILYVCTGSDLALAFERGKIPTEEFLLNLKQSLQFKKDLDTLKLLWSDIFTRIPENFAILENLVERYTVGLISNTNPLHFEFIRGKNFEMNLFHRLSLSYEQGVMKPDLKIFRHAVEPYDFKSEQIVFIDDIAKNLDGAIQLGWQTIHLTKEKKLKDELKELSVTTE